MRTEKENHYLLKAVDALKNRLIVVSPDFEILAANHSSDDANGPIVGQFCHMVYYENESPCENCSVREVLETGRPSLRPQEQPSPSLNNIPCYYAYPIFDGDRIEAVVSMDLSIPHKGVAENETHRANALLHNLLLSAPDGVIAADMKGRILIFNQAAEQISGFTAEEALNEMTIHDIYRGGIEYVIMQNLRSKEYGGKGKLYSYRVEVIDKAKNRIPISLNASIVYDGDKEVATIGFFRDLREKIKMQKELERTQVQLLQAEKMSSLGKLAAGVAHQLNNPLGGITLFTQLILEEHDLNEDISKDLNRILKDAMRCRDTVKELLEFSRQTRHFIQPQDINQALSRTLFLLENQTLFHNIEIIKELAPSLPLVPVDIQQINHVFMNIILNAAQAMKGEGVLTIKTSLNHEKNMAIIKISDSGPGIPNSILPRIFDPFFTTKEEGEGTGLGLSLVYSIIENHGGRIEAKNNTDRGARFTIEIPLRRKAHEGKTGEQTV